MYWYHTFYIKIIKDKIKRINLCTIQELTLLNDSYKYLKINFLYFDFLE